MSTDEYALVRKDPAYGPPRGSWERAFEEFSDRGPRGERAFLEDLDNALDLIERG